MRRDSDLLILIIKLINMNRKSYIILYKIISNIWRKQKKKKIFKGMNCKNIV